MNHNTLSKGASVLRVNKLLNTNEMNKYLLWLNIQGYIHCFPISSGAQDDLRKVTDMAYKCVRELGMSDTVGHISFPQAEGAEFAGKPYSKALSQLIDNEVQQLVAKAYHETEQLMTANKDKLKKVNH